MAGKRVTTELVVKAVDQYSGVIRNMTGVTGRFASKVRSEMGRMQGLRGPLRMIEDFRRQQDVVRVSASALDAANEKTRQLLATIRATKNPTAAMRREFERARATAGRLQEKHRRNRAELRGLQSQMQTAGVDTSDLAVEQRRLAGALDVANSKFARQAERMQRLKVMQDRIAEGRERMQRSLATAANLSFVGNASMGVGRRILGITDDVAQRSGNQQEAFTEFQNLTGVDDARISRLRDELSGLRDVTKQSVDEMLAGLGVLVGKGMDLEAALGALPATARAAFATDTSSDEMGASGFALYDNLGISPENLRSAYDIMAMGGKEGGFELTAMASSFPEITAGARSLGMGGLGAVAELTAALQVAMKSAGSETQAATNLSNFLGKLTSPATVRKFAEVGISIEEELQKAMERGVSPMEHMLEVIAEQTDGDALKMGELFEDKQVLDFLRAMIPNMEEYARIRDAALNADGVVDEDLERRLRDFNVQRGQLGESLSNLFTLPPEVLDTLTAMLVRADAFVERLIVWKQENPAFAKGLFLGAAALGAMAVAGGAMLVTASGLIGTMAVLRFGLVGLGARAVFAGGGLASLAGRFGVLRRLPRFALSSLVTPLRWTSRFIGRIPWAVLTGGRFLLSGLVTPLRWVARFIPSIGWRALAGGLQWSSLIRPLTWLARGALRFIHPIGWAVLAGELLWHLLIKPLGWDEYLSLEALGGYLETVKSWFTWDNLTNVIDWAVYLPFAPLDSVLNLLFGFDWADKLPSWSWDFITEFDMAGLITWPEAPDWLKWLMGQEEEAAALPRQPLQPSVMLAPGFEQLTPEQQAATRTVISSQSVGLPTAAHLQELRDYAASLREEIAGIQGDIDNLGQGPMAASMAMPHQQTMAVRKRELQEVEAELVDAEARSVTLTAALQVLDGTEATPEINAASIDRALEKVARLSAQLRSMPGASASASVTPPVRPAGARAFGGPVRAGLPYLVNERTAKSEWFVPSTSGGILNVGQAQTVFRSALTSSKFSGGLLNRGAGRAVAAGKPVVDSTTAGAAFQRETQLSRKLRSLPSRTARASMPKLAGARALGGPVRAGLPYLVNERTAKSEWFVPSTSGGILNVGQAQSVFRSALTSGKFSGGALSRSVGRVRAASMAALASSALSAAAPAAAAPVNISLASGKGGAERRVEVHINGPINIPVPASVTDPHTIAGLAADILGDRVQATFDASHSD